METKTAGTIHYGFDMDYLKNWGIKEALREIYQNFMDFGEYTEEVEGDDESEAVMVTLSNDFKPDGLSFLRIGLSNKGGNQNAVGKHGEGLKMAFLVFHREKDCQMFLTTDKYKVTSAVHDDEEIGPCFCLEYEDNYLTNERFEVTFICNREIYNEFKSKIITDDDIEFTDSSHGSVVKKPAGQIYSGKLFVCELKGFSKAYDILPSQMPLDRDRCVPKSFDVNYHSSKINEAYQKWDTDDTTYSDTEYINHVPERIKKRYKPMKVGNSVEFVSKDKEGNTKVLKNESIKRSLARDSFFKESIRSLKRFIAKQLGLYDLLIEFQKKHVLGEDAKRDFEIILERVKK